MNVMSAVNSRALLGVEKHNYMFTAPWYGQIHFSLQKHIKQY